MSRRGEQVQRRPSFSVSPSLQWLKLIWSNSIFHFVVITCASSCFFFVFVSPSTLLLIQCQSTNICCFAAKLRLLQLVSTSSFFWRRCRTRFVDKWCWTNKRECKVIHQRRHLSFFFLVFSRWLDFKKRRRRKKNSREGQAVSSATIDVIDQRKKDQRQNSFSWNQRG